MRLWLFFCIGFFFIFITGIAFALPASEFAARYQETLSKGEIITIHVKMRGEPQTEDPLERAREIRQLQGGIVKFSIRAGATNIKSDTWNNEFTADVTTSLAQHLAQRGDVVSIDIILNDFKKLSQRLQAVLSNIDTSTLPSWVKIVLHWSNEKTISEDEVISNIQYLIKKGIIATQ
jgi:hypothetical protein